MLGKIETEKQIIDGYNSGNGRTVTYVYDVKGMVLSKLYPVSGDTISYTRDALDRVDKVSKGSAEIVDYEWSGPRTIKKSYPGSYCTYTYDGYGQLTDIHAIDTSSGHTLDEFVYGFDRSGQITSEDTIYYDDVQNTRISGASHLDEGDQYAYDGAKRLVTVLRGVPTANINDTIANNIANAHVRDKGIFTYDQTGNRVTRSSNGANDQTFVNDQANQISKEGTSTLSNDKNGNYLGSTNTLAYTWDNHWGRYIVAGSPATTHTWHFDAFGRKVEWVGNRDYRYYYDSDQEVEHVEWAASAESGRKELIWGDRIDDLLFYQFQIPNPDQDYYAHADYLGSVQLLCDSSGAVQESYRYWEWGQTTVVDSTFTKLTGTDSDSKNNVRYAGRDQYNIIGDQNDSWYNNRARAYRTKWGRFMESDPLGHIAGPNAFIYTHDSPVDRRDPAGLSDGQEFAICLLDCLECGDPDPLSALWKAIFCANCTTCIASGVIPLGRFLNSSGAGFTDPTTKYTIFPRPSSHDTVKY
jgi:RHS repeat-associated protein